MLRELRATQRLRASALPCPKIQSFSVQLIGNITTPMQTLRACGVVDDSGVQLHVSRTLRVGHPPPNGLDSKLTERCSRQNACHDCRSGPWEMPEQRSGGRSTTKLFLTRSRWQRRCVPQDPSRFVARRSGLLVGQARAAKWWTVHHSPWVKTRSRRGRLATVLPMHLSRIATRRWTVHHASAQCPAGLLVDRPPPERLNSTPAAMCLLCSTRQSWR